MRLPDSIAKMSSGWKDNSDCVEASTIAVLVLVGGTQEAATAGLRNPSRKLCGIRYVNVDGDVSAPRLVEGDDVNFGDSVTAQLGVS